eukprot:SAG11_NODE_1604_length_4596_cov_22.286636_3_plen_782_part_00
MVHTSPKAPATAVGNLGKSSVHAVANIGSSIKEGPLAVTKSVAKGAVAVGTGVGVVGATTVGTGASFVHDVADATKVSAVAGALGSGLHITSVVPQPISPYENDSAFQQLKELAVEAATTEEEEGSGTRNRILAAMCWLEIMANFDAGVLPATIGMVMSEFKLDYADGGSLGALVYLGLVLGAPIAGWALTNFLSQRKLLVASAICNCCGVLSFALAPNTFILYVGRFMIGLTQAPIIIYLPVWVDEFAPPDLQAMWMALLQASVAMGIMFGYVTAGLIVTYWGEEICHDDSQGHDDTHGGHGGCWNPRWRVPLYIQACGVLSMAPFFMYVKGRHFNAKGGPEGRIKWRTVKHFHRLREAANIKRQPTISSPEIKPGTETKANELQRFKSGEWVRESVYRFNNEGSDVATANSAPDVSNKYDKHSVAHHMDGFDGMHLGESIGIMEIFGHDHGGGGSLTDSHVCHQLELMMKSKLFVSLTLALSGLYFVVTGIQYWVTDYLTLPIAEGGMGIDQGTVVISFAVSSLTGPTAGVFFGGWIIDRQGGYKCDTGKAAMDTLRTSSYFGIGAVACAIPTAFGTNYWFIMGTMWFVLFFGGALLSPCTGVCLNSVHPDLRSFSSALSMFAYNIFGYAAAPFVAGIIGEKFGIAWGFRVVLLFSTVCLLGLLFAYKTSKSLYFSGEAATTDTSDLANSVSVREIEHASIDFSNPLTEAAAQRSTDSADGGALTNGSNDEDEIMKERRSPRSQSASGNVTLARSRTTSSKDNKDNGMSVSLMADSLDA